MSDSVARTCAEHQSCRIPATLSSKNVDVVRKSGIVGFYLSVWFGDDQLGTVQDKGYLKAAGGYVERWAAYSGGGEIARDLPTRDAAVRALVEHVITFSFHMRMALHG